MTLYQSIDEIISYLHNKYNSYNIFEIDSGSPPDNEYSENGFHIIRYNKTNRVCIAVDNNFPFTIAAWLYDLDRSTLKMHFE